MLYRYGFDIILWNVYIYIHGFNGISWGYDPFLFLIISKLSNIKHPTKPWNSVFLIKGWVIPCYPYWMLEGKGGGNHSAVPHSETNRIKHLVYLPRPTRLYAGYIELVGSVYRAPPCNFPSLAGFGNTSSNQELALTQLCLAFYLPT